MKEKRNHSRAAGQVTLHVQVSEMLKAQMKDLAKKDRRGLSDWVGLRLAEATDREQKKAKPS